MGNRDIKGIIAVAVFIRGDDRKILFYPVLADGIHGVNSHSQTLTKSMNNIKVCDIEMKNSFYGLVVKDKWSFKVDINLDKDFDDIVDGVYEGSAPAIKCELM